MPLDAPLLLGEMVAALTALGALWKLLGDDTTPPLPTPIRANGHTNGDHALYEVRLGNLETGFDTLVATQQQHGKKLDMLIEFQLRKPQ